jgi:hypothetical protein
MGWLFFFLFGGDILTAKAIGAGMKHSKVFRRIVWFFVGVFVFLGIGLFVVVVMMEDNHNSYRRAYPYYNCDGHPSDHPCR